jgi:hypothetical protein
LIREEAGRFGRLDVAMCLEVEHKAIVGEDSGLWETVFAFVDLSVYNTIVCDDTQSIVCYDGGRDVF